MDERYSIRQNEAVVLSSNSSLRMIWKNLTGENIRGEEYRRYVNFALSEGFRRGSIELFDGNKLMGKGEIK